MSGSAQPLRAQLLVTDLDNTLWDWFAIWYESFRLLLDGVAEKSGISVETLENQIRQIHQRRGTSEYSVLLAEIPALLELDPGADMSVVYSDAIHRFRSARKTHTKLYPGVAETLRVVKAAGIPIVAYTESLSFYSAMRIRALGLDGVIDVLYSSPDHDFPNGVEASTLRSRPDSEYDLAYTQHRHVPRGVLKPDALILKEIIAEMGVEPARTVYVGDSLMKDVAMAQAVGALDVLAAYGMSQNRPGYELLRRVSHWTQADVDREREIGARPHVTPTYSLARSFDELLGLFTFGDQ